MLSLSGLKNSTRSYKRRKLLGRGVGSKRGKTSGRGVKGAGSRSGWTSRAGYEGGQFRFYMKVPKRGFSNAPFQYKIASLNLSQIDKSFKDGEKVTLATLKEKGLIPNRAERVKLLGVGELKKRVEIHVNAASATAQEKLQKAKISFTVDA